MNINPTQRNNTSTTTNAVPPFDIEAPGQTSNIPLPTPRRTPRFEKGQIHPGRWQIGRIMAQKFFGDGLMQLAARTGGQYIVGEILKTTLAAQNRAAINLTCYVTGGINTAFFAGMMTKTTYKYYTEQYNDFDFRFDMATAATQCAISIGSMAAVSLPMLSDHTAAGITTWQAKTSVAQIGRMFRACLQRGLKTFDNRCATKLTASRNGAPVDAAVLGTAQVRFNQAVYGLSAMLIGGGLPAGLPKPSAAYVIRVLEQAVKAADQLYTEQNATAEPEPQPEPEPADFETDGIDNSTAPQPEPQPMPDNVDGMMADIFRAFDSQFSFRQDGLPYIGAILEALDGITPDLANYFFLHCFEKKYTNTLKFFGIEADEMSLEWEMDVRPYKAGCSNIPKIIDNWMARNHMGAPIDLLFLTTTTIRHFVNLDATGNDIVNWVEAVLLSAACMLAIGLFPTSDGRKNIHDDGNVDMKEQADAAAKAAQSQTTTTVSLDRMPHLERDADETSVVGNDKESESTVGSSDEVKNDRRSSDDIEIPMPSNNSAPPPEDNANAIQAGKEAGNDSTKDNSGN